jgi:hypothetical protein
MARWPVTQSKLLMGNEDSPPNTEPNISKFTSDYGHHTEPQRLSRNAVKSRWIKMGVQF